jgi:hypothetical protein
MATFTAPNEESTLEFKLTVIDNQGQTDSTTIKVEVKGSDAESSSGADTTRWSSKTDRVTKKRLHYFMSNLRLGLEDYNKLLLLDLDIKTTQMNICDYIFLSEERRT